MSDIGNPFCADHAAIKSNCRVCALMAERSEWEEKWAAANAYSDTLIEAKNRAQMERDASGAHLRETILELRTANDYANSQSRAAGILAAKVEELANALQTALQRANDQEARAEMAEHDADAQAQRAEQAEAALAQAQVGASEIVAPDQATHPRVDGVRTHPAVQCHRLREAGR
jgi:hypothetical protein